jgi:succinyl-CoA synthetase beta subunit
MNIHEYQAKGILKRYGIPIPPYGVAASVEEARAIVSELGLTSAVVKVQVHAGGRGRAGGVKFGKSRDEIIAAAEQLLNMKIVNNQTGPEGVVASQVIISEPAEIAHEYYVGCVIDREAARPMLIASPEGGMEIEEIAQKSPEKILKIAFGNDGTMRRYQLLRVAKFMGWSGETAKAGMRVIAGLCKAFIDTDASLLEINPLVLTPNGEIVALDAKLSVDDNALFRQPEIKGFYDPTQIPAAEVEAQKHELAYVALDGEIGCMVNGAGLAMATMDLIQYYGGTPANFLDVGGSATKEKVAAGFRIILSDPKVKAILVNIFGGIMNCVTIAEGIIAAANEMDISVPLVVRLEGTHVEQGKKLLAESGLNLIAAEGLAQAAQKVVGALR